MQLRLDPESPLPLYHQLAEALRYRIATGAITPGTILPSLREAARRWRVNLHTVRHAYAALADEGLVRTEVPRGTVVLGGAIPSGRKSDAGRRALASDRFLERMVREAGARYGLTPEEVGRRIAQLGAGRMAAGAAETVHVVECSETQAADLASQVSARWEMTARGWSLERPGEPPDGPVVATYFHYNDVRTRWPERFPSVHFVAIHPDPDLASRLAKLRRRGRRTKVKVRVAERDAAMAANIVADLRAVLPAREFELEPIVKSRPGQASHGSPVLYSPRCWAALSPAERADPRRIEIRYLIEPRDLEALGEELDWIPRNPAAAIRPKVRLASVSSA